MLKLGYKYLQSSSAHNAPCRRPLLSFVLETREDKDLVRRRILEVQAAPKACAFRGMVLAFGVRQRF